MDEKAGNPGKGGATAQIIQAFFAGLFQSRIALGLHVFTVLAIAVSLRSGIFSIPLAEHDEMIYRALVEQVTSGRDYSLQGHPILESGWVEKKMYDSPVFFHPPAGIYYFALFARTVSDLDTSLKWAQLFAFATYFLCMLFASRRLLAPDSPRWIHWLLPVLLAFTPIPAHIAFKVWLEGPRLMAAGLCLALAILASKRGSPLACIFLAVCALLSVFIKLDGVLSLPFVFFLGLGLAEAGRRRALAKFFMAVFFVSFAASLAWLAYSEALHYGPGRPTQALMDANSFVRHVTLEITPADYLLNFAKLVSTLIPASLIVLLCPIIARQRVDLSWNPRWALILWVLSHTGLYVFLSAIGYSKMLRYLILTAPATCLLFGFACHDLREVWRQVGQTPGPRRGLAIGLGVALALGFSIEAYQGFHIMRFRKRDALVSPLF